MLEGKKILILDLIIFLISFIFVFWLSKLDFILNFIVWMGGWVAVALVHEAGHAFVCAASGGFPLIMPSFLDAGGFTLVTHCTFYGASVNVITDSIITIFGIVFECISIFILFYLAFAINERSWLGLTSSFITFIFAWINVGLLQREITSTFSGSDIAHSISISGVSINTIVTSITASTIILVIIALRYGLEEEQKSGKINVINIDILPLEITYANFFRFLFFILCTFLGFNILVLFFRPNAIGIVMAILLATFAFYLHTIYSIGNKFRHIIANIKINLKEVKTFFSFLSAVFQCTTEKNIIFSVVYNREGWIVNLPSKNISVKLPPFVTAEDIAKRIESIFMHNKLR